MLAVRQLLARKVLTEAILYSPLSHQLVVVVAVVAVLEALFRVSQAVLVVAVLVDSKLQEVLEHQDKEVTVGLDGLLMVNLLLVVVAVLMLLAEQPQLEMMLVLVALAQLHPSLAAP